MLTISIHEAKTHLSRLVDQAAKGESFIIAKGGKPMVKVMALDAPLCEQTKRIGFMAGQIAVPDDFDTWEAGKLRRCSTVTSEIAA